MLPTQLNVKKCGFKYVKILIKINYVEYLDGLYAGGYFIKEN